MTSAAPDDDTAPEASAPAEVSPAEDQGEEVHGEVVDDEPSASPRIEIQRAEFKGPLPHPSILREYGEVLPGLEREIVDQWKAETAHRHRTIDAMRATDQQAMECFYAGEKRGQIFGLIAVALIVALAALAILLDYPLVGLGTVLVGGGVLIWAMRRSSVGPSEPTDVGDPDQVESLPEQPNQG